MPAGEPHARRPVAAREPAPWVLDADGTAVCAALARLGLGSYEVARRAGVAYPTVRRACDGRPLWLRPAVAIAEALGVPVGDLVEEARACSRRWTPPGPAEWATRQYRRSAEVPEPLP
jgi:hypothetical protein